MIFESKIARTPATQTRYQPEIQLPLQRKCASGAKKSALASEDLSKPADACEVEADRAAERVMTGDVADASLQTPSSVRSLHVGGSATSAVPETLGSPGRPLDCSTRDFMEPRFRHDFSRVRIHADERAATAANAVNARAFTVGNHIAFAAGQFVPATASGRKLLAHELTHVVQQQSLNFAVLQGKSAEVRPEDPLEEDEEDPRKYQGPMAAPWEEDEEKNLREYQGPTAVPYKEPTPPPEPTPQGKKVEVRAPEFTAKLYGGFEAARGLKPSEERSSARVAGFELGVEKEGTAGGAASFEKKLETDRTASGESEFSEESQIKLEAKLPVESWILGGHEKVEKRIRPFVFLKEVTLGGSLASKRQLPWMKSFLREAAFDYSVRLIGLKLSDRKVRRALFDFDVDLVLEGSVGGEQERPPRERKRSWRGKYDIGGKAVSRLAVRPTGGRFFIFVEATFQISTTKDGDGRFGPGVFQFTGVAGPGVTLPSPTGRKKQKNR